MTSKSTGSRRTFSHNTTDYQGRLSGGRYNKWVFENNKGTNPGINKGILSITQKQRVIG